MHTTGKDEIIKVIIKIFAIILLTITINFSLFELSASAASCSFTANQVINAFAKNGLIRGGERLENAAYGMSELEKPSDLLDLLKDPASKPEFCQHWKDHLYNSIWKISDLSQLREYNLIVALGVPPSSNERYNAPNGRGDLKTFKKINNVGNNAIFVKNKKFNEPDDEKAYEWVLRILDGKND